MNNYLSIKLWQELVLNFECQLILCLEIGDNKINKNPIMIPKEWLNLTLASVEWPLKCQHENHFHVVGKMFQEKQKVIRDLKPEKAAWDHKA